MGHHDRNLVSSTTWWLPPHRRKGSAESTGPMTDALNLNLTIIWSVSCILRRQVKALKSPLHRFKAQRRPTQIKSPSDHRTQASRALCEE